MSEDERAVRALYSALLHAWNERDAEAFAAQFLSEGSMIGYDGSIVDGQAEIAQHIGDVFRHHQTPLYTARVKRVRFLTPESAIVRGHVGMRTAPTLVINPALNAIQSLVAQWVDGAWRVALFQNTPAQFHGRPDLVAAMTEELQRALDEQGTGGR
jgi:uncharacterized protein (TIGR02246 family)